MDDTKLCSLKLLRTKVEKRVNSYTKILSKKKHLFSTYNYKMPCIMYLFMGH